MRVCNKKNGAIPNKGYRFGIQEISSHYFAEGFKMVFRDVGEVIEYDLLHADT